MSRHLPSRRLRHLLTALLAACVLGAATPLANAQDDLPVEPDGSCRPKAWEGQGHISLSGGGTYSIVGTWTDGCGGRGCDDSVQGTVYRGGRRWTSFGVQEALNSQGWCVASCTFGGWDGKIQRYQPVRPDGDAVTFYCGDYFSGFLDWGVPVGAVAGEVVQDVSQDLVSDLTKDILA